MGRWTRVHPRVCGGAGDEVPESGDRTGSIPACAGEPSRRARGNRPITVHPRVCGGAEGTHEASITVEGSIPACAGEPPPSTNRTGSRWVHPRVCGGAFAEAAVAASTSGPSPRVRGSRDDGVLVVGLGGSIPACAGEPWTGGQERLWRRVHPRVRGAAVDNLAVDLAREGSSPPARGRQDVRERNPAGVGFIPARAGPTPRTVTPKRVLRVHPRPRGAALPVGSGCAPTRVHPRFRGCFSSRLSRDPPVLVHPRVRGVLVLYLVTG